MVRDRNGCPGMCGELEKTRPVWQRRTDGRDTDRVSGMCGESEKNRQEVKRHTGETGNNRYMGMNGNSAMKGHEQKENTVGLFSRGRILANLIFVGAVALFMLTGLTGCGSRADSEGGSEEVNSEGTASEQDGSVSGNDSGKDGSVSKNGSEQDGSVSKNGFGQDGASSENGFDQDEADTENASGQNGSTAENTSGNKSDSRPTDDAGTEDSKTRVMVGPQTPPEGERYDEWKKFEYSDETSFNVKSFFTIVTTDGNSPKEDGIIYSPEIDGTLEITDASSEPVGGEMKLRSGGYVDITVKARWEGTINIQYEGNANVFVDKMAFSNVSPEPCDAYTGTAFLNNVSNEENQDANEIGVGEAVADSLIESDVTWKSHTWRIYVGDDLKNSSFSEPQVSVKGDLTTESDPVSTIETFTFRVPADYDGLVLCIPKDITTHMDKRLNSEGDFIEVDDRYADVLTDFTGQKHDADDYYFVRVSDLLEKFGSDDAQETQNGD